MNDWEDRFWAKVEKRAPDECWPWRAGSFRRGYGAFKLARKQVKAHRVAFFLTHGRWPEPCGLHSCDNPPCCNPGHVFEGTHADNAMDKKKKGRSTRGERNRHARANATAVSAIRSRHAAGDVSQVALAEEYGLTPQIVWRMLAGQTWGHV